MSNKHETKTTRNAGNPRARDGNNSFTRIQNEEEEGTQFQFSLCRYLPTPKDAERYLSFKGSCSELHVVDQFMLEVRCDALIYFYLFCREEF